MVIIFSENNDISTNLVIDWICYNNKEFLRINESDNINIQKISISNNKNFDNIIIDTSINGKRHIIDFNKVSSFWYRRGGISIKTKIINSEKSDLDEEMNSEKKGELRTLIEFIHFFMKNKKSIGNFEDNYTNKLINLQIAKEFSLLIPETQILSTKAQLYEFIKIHKQVITKPSKQGSLMGLNTQLNVFTEYISNKTMEQIPDFFEPSLFQELIHKKLDVRSFFINNKIYSMAIFSQKDIMTKVDFRNYNDYTPNRTIPFKLPYDIENKIINFMESVNMNCGSLDFILTRNGDFYFLEVNPVGQFYQVSYPCNYYLEKIIANHLI